MTTVIERTLGHYEVQKTPYGEDYVWFPECVTVECDCGETSVLTASEAVCRCGADHAAVVGEELAPRRSSEEDQHPLDDEHREWRERQGEFLHSETHYWLEWRFIE